jgi:hypothetical protein
LDKEKDIMKTVAISQSNYIPWKGYFDFINRVDEFILYDEVQYTTRDWRNRNRIKTPHGLKWLTIPVKGNNRQMINETVIADPDWNEKHWNTIYHMYKKAPFFDRYSDKIYGLYESCGDYTRLSDINHHFLTGLNTLLEIETPLTWSTEYDSGEGQTMRLISICKQAGASAYVTGEAARSYLDESLFNQYDIEVIWMKYEGYEEYPQIHGDFEHRVSVIDLLFNTGDNSRDYMLF